MTVTRREAGSGGWYLRIICDKRFISAARGHNSHVAHVAHMLLANGQAKLYASTAKRTDTRLVPLAMIWWKIEALLSATTMGLHQMLSVIDHLPGQDSGPSPYGP